MEKQECKGICTDEYLNKNQLWAKAATSEPISRKDLGIASANNESGMQVLNEGYLGDMQRYSFNEKTNDK